MRRPSLAVVVLLLSAGLAAVLPAAHGAAASAQPAAGMRITDWLEANAGISVGKPQSKPAAVGIAATGASDKQAKPAGPSYESHKETLCFKEKQRCGTFSYDDSIDGLPGYTNAEAYYQSYLGCSGHEEEPRGYGERSEEGFDEMFGLSGGSVIDARADAVGSCFIDVYGTQVPVTPGVSVGHAQISCDITDSPKCGIEGCNGATISMGVGKAYVVRQAISFERASVPATCPELGIQIRTGGRAAKTPSTGSQQPAAGAPQAPASRRAARGAHSRPMPRNVEGFSSMLFGGLATAAADAKVQVAAAAVPAYDDDTKYVCIGPAMVVSGPVTVASRSGDTDYKSGWVTYESFLYNSDDGDNDVRCGELYSSVAHLGLPVIEPNSYSFELDKAGKAYSS